MKAWYILLFLAVAMLVATASAEITGNVVVSDGNVAWTTASAIGGELDADQDTDVSGYDTVSAEQTVSAEGIQATATTGAISSDGDLAVTTAVVQEGSLDITQNSVADDDYAAASQNTITVENGGLEGERVYAGSYAVDEHGNEAGTEIAAIGSHRADATIQTTQGAEAGEVAGVNPPASINVNGHDVITLSTHDGADAKQTSSATGSEIYAGSFASNRDSYAATGIAVEGGRRDAASLLTEQLAGADRRTAGALQIVSIADGRETETFTIGANDERRDKSVVIIGKYGRGQTSTQQGAVAGDREVEAVANTEAESHRSISFIEAESGRNDRDAVAFGDDIFQFGVANNNHHHNVFVISHGH